MTNKLIATLIVAAAGCGAMQQPGSATGDDGGSGSDMMGSGSNSSPHQLHGSVLDERNDAIDFSSGEPRHTHGGAAVALSENGCADVYKYAYLMSALPPLYGYESAANPIAWEVTAADMDPTKTTYRVRGDASQTLLDWTATTPDADGQYAIALYRDGAHGVPALGTTDGKMYLDIRFHDAHGTEVIQSGCWNNHPLAAPLYVASSNAGDLLGMTLPGNSPISYVMGTHAEPYRMIHIQQQTGEPIRLRLSAQTPTGTVSKTAVDTWVVAAAADIPAGDCSTNTACARPSIPTVSTPSSAPLAATWSINIVDETQNTTLCSATSLDVTCTIPARAADQIPEAYVVQIFVGSIDPLRVGGALDVNSEWTAGSYGSYTGTAPGATTYYCDTIKPHLSDLYCTQASQRQHILALDRATIAFDAIPLALLTYASDNGSAPSYLAPSALAIPAQTWDAGDKGLPLN